MSLGNGDMNLMFEQLKSGLARPLAGMGTAFSASMFGLAGALVLGFLDLTAGQAQNRFFNELEEWLAGLTRLSSGVLSEGEGSVRSMSRRCWNRPRRTWKACNASWRATRKPRPGQPGDA